MDEYDIKELVSELQNARKSEDWDRIEDAIDFLKEFIEDEEIEEE